MQKKPNAETKLKNALTRAKAKIKTLLAENKALKTKVSAYEDTIESLRDRIAGLKQDLEQESKKAQVAEQELSYAYSKLTTRENRIEELYTERTRLVDQFNRYMTSILNR